MRSKELKEMWEECAQIIKDNVSAEQFETWFKCIEPASYIDKQLIIAVPSHFVYEYLETTYIDLISKVITRVFGHGIQLSYKIKQIACHEEIESSGVQNPSSQITDATQTPDIVSSISSNELDSQLKEGYTFDNFIEGESNRLARSVGEAIAKNPAKTFNPLFIYGPSGCGKTHLVNAIGWSIKQQHPQLRVLYLSAHLFKVQYTNAVRQNKLPEFITFYQTIDVLIIDDAQELSGQTKTQNTFYHIFNHLHLNKKQIILTADRPPMAIQGLEDRLLTRFKWGLQAEIEKPTKSLCRAILQHKVKQDSIPMPDTVVNYIADRVNSSVRDLEGIINSLMAYSVVYKCDINMKLVDQILPRFITVNNSPITIADIKQHLCKRYGVSETELCSKSRRQLINQIRQTAVYLASKLTECSNTQIGEHLGGRTHATVLHAIKHIKELTEVDNKFRQEVEELENEIKRNI